MTSQVNAIDMNAIDMNAAEEFYVVMSDGEDQVVTAMFETEGHAHAFATDEAEAFDNVSILFCLEGEVMSQMSIKGLLG